MLSPLYEGVDGLDDLLCFGFAHRGADGEGELGAVYLLGDGQRQVGILSVALLFMGLLKARACSKIAV